MKKFTKEELKKFRDEFNVAVKGLKKEFGVAIELGNISYSTDNFRTKMEVTRAVSDSGSKIDIDKEKFKKSASLIGVSESLYGTNISFSGREFRITGIKPRSTKYSIVAEEISSGKSYKLPLRAVE